MPPPLRCPSMVSAAACAQQLCKAPLSRPFSSTAHNEQRITRARQQLFRWLNGKGGRFYNPSENGTNYISAPGLDPNANPENHTPLRPFLLNRSFLSQPILAESTREEIWKRIMEDGQSVRDVSEALGVEMRRVAAVVRLKEVEKEWLRIGKPLARPYAEAVRSMLPKEDENRLALDMPFESINDLTLHSATSPQIFHPTSESRHFTRVDAARVFDRELLPADDRIPHPQIVLRQKDLIAGFSEQEAKARQAARDEAAEKRRQIKMAKKAQKEADSVRAVDTERWRFRITEVNVDDAGKTGRGEKGVGWRYGAPLMDRKKGMVRIPMKVE